MTTLFQLSLQARNCWEVEFKMDKNQVHKVGKMLNKPVKFVKKNMGIISTAVIAYGGPMLAKYLKERKNK